MRETNTQKSFSKVFHRKPWTNQLIPCGLIALLLIATLSLTGCNSLTNTISAAEKNALSPVASSEQGVKKVATMTLQKTVVDAPLFAPYEEVPVNLKPAVAPYAVTADLGNIIPPPVIGI